MMMLRLQSADRDRTWTHESFEDVCGTNEADLHFVLFDQSDGSASPCGRHHDKLIKVLSESVRARRSETGRNNVMTRTLLEPDELEQQPIKSRLPAAGHSSETDTSLDHVDFIYFSIKVRLQGRVRTAG